MQQTYLICFAETPISHARHYIGVTNDLSARVLAHRRGCGSKLLAELRRQGNSFVVTREWLGNCEKELKRQKNGPKLCPKWNPKALARKAISHQPEDFQDMKNNILRRLAA